jgi:hypothetical protein
MDLLKFERRIETPKNSVFYTFARYQGKLLGFGRRSVFPDWTVRDISCNELDDDFTNMRETRVIRGEDPRVFVHQGKTYVIDGYLNDVHMYCIDEGYRRIKLQLPGKNLSFLSVGSQVFVVFSFMPFIMVEIDIDTGRVIRQLDVDNERPMKYLLYRGSTYGHHLKDNYWYGFGHMTYHGHKHPMKPEDIVYHDPFLWIVKMDTVPKLQMFIVHKPPKALRIFDPACIFEGKVFSAESDLLWGEDTDYVTNMYSLDIDKIKALVD